MADEKQTFTVAGYKFATKEEAQAVSYTHLTLPTIA